MSYGYVVLASTQGEFIANAIKWFTRSRFSHSFVTVPAQIGREMCIEADGNGIAEIEFDVGYRNNPAQTYMVYRVNLPQEVIDKALQACLDDLEHKYAYLAYPWFIYRTLMWKLFKKDIKAKNNWYTKNLVCSGLVRLYLDAESVRDHLSSKGLQNLFSGYGLGSMAPEDLFYVLEANPELFTKIEAKGF